MSKIKHIGLDVHQASISVTVLDESGKLVMQSVIATRAAAVLEFLGGLRGTLHITFEEGTYSAWLHDLLVRRVGKVVVCNPRKNALLKKGNKSDRIDALKLAELLRGGMLSPVYHGENSTRTLQELGRSYMTVTLDATRVMSRLKAIYRGQAITYGGKKLYTRRHRGEWLKQLKQPGLLRRAERLYEELDLLQQLRRQAKQELMVESQKHPVCARLRTIPYLGPIRAAVLLQMACASTSLDIVISATRRTPPGSDFPQSRDRTRESPRHSRARVSSGTVADDSSRIHLRARHKSRHRS